MSVVRFCQYFFCEYHVFLPSNAGTFRRMGKISGKYYRYFLRDYLELKKHYFA